MSERISSVPVETGLYALRYVGTSTQPDAPSVTVKPAKGHEPYIDIITAPGVAAGSIEGMGGCVVVRASRSGNLDVSVRQASATAGSSEIELRLEWLASAGSQAEPQVSSLLTADATELELAAHVSRRGDVKVTRDQWIAGPAAPAPIEGIQAQPVGATSGLEVEYQVLVGGTNGAWTGWVKNGLYAGTRGQFRSLLAIRMRLSGDLASSFVLQAEGLFLGSSIQKASGQQIELISASGVDPLVGLKIALNSSRIESGQQGPVDRQRTDQPADRRSGRVRVFRASGAR